MSSLLNIDSALLEAVISSVHKGLSMTGIEARAVGASRLMSARMPYSIIVGLVGKSSGTITLSLGEKGLLLLASGLLGEDMTSPNDDAFDALMEIGNMTAGALKDALRGTTYNVAEISLPSVVLGASYDVYYSRGIDTLSVAFELDRIPASQFGDRYFSCSLALLNRPGE